MYIVEKVFVKTTNWRCRSSPKRSFGCKARVVALNENGYISKSIGDHNHPPPLPKKWEMRLCFERCVVCWQNTLLSDYVDCIPRTTKTRMGKTVLIDSGDFVYLQHIQSDKKTSWRCRSCNIGCRARVTTLNENGYIIKFPSGHNHPPPLQTHF